MLWCERKSVLSDSCYLFCMSWCADHTNSTHFHHNFLAYKVAAAWSVWWGYIPGCAFLCNYHHHVQWIRWSFNDYCPSPCCLQAARSSVLPSVDICHFHFRVVTPNICDWVHDLDWHHILCNWICAWTWQVTRHLFCWNLVVFFLSILCSSEFITAFVWFLNPKP